MRETGWERKGDRSEGKGGERWKGKDVTQTVACSFYKGIR